MTYVCPNCGNAEFEERGDVRCYTPTIVVERAGKPVFEADITKSWSAPIETYEADEIPYVCLKCDAEFENASELLKTEGERCTPTSP